MSDTVPAKPDSSALEAHLGYWLRRVSNHVSGAFARAQEARHVSVASVKPAVGRSEQPRPQPIIPVGMLSVFLSLPRGRLDSSKGQVYKRRMALAIRIIVMGANGVEI
jgi:hypothetical protein